MKRVYKIILIALLVIFLLIVLYLSRWYIFGFFIKSPNLKFSANSCDDKIYPYRDKFPLIEQTTWIDENTLTISAYASINCLEYIPFGIYTIKNTDLIIRYKVASNNAWRAATCNCVHELNYTIKNVKKVDYKIRIEEFTSLFS